jgi:hypothetical protein
MWRLNLKFDMFLQLNVNGRHYPNNTFVTAFQFTIPGGRHTLHHTSLLQNAGAPRVLRAAAAATTAPIEAKVFAKIILRNLEHHHLEALN